MMDSYSLHNRKLWRITSLLRFVEVCVVLVLASKLFLHVPVAVKSSGEYFRDFSVFCNSPRIVFLIGNAIIITLFVQSGQFSAQGSRKKDPGHDLYQEFVQKSTKSQRMILENQKNPEEQSTGTEGKTEYHEQQAGTDKNDYPEKKGIGIEHSIKNSRTSENVKRTSKNHRIFPSKLSKFGIRNKGIFSAGKSKLPEKQSLKTEEVIKDYKRYQTEIISRSANSEEHTRGVLRRCETEKNRIKSIEPAPHTKEEDGEEEGGGEEEGVSCIEDSMSNEEFRRTVEAFIAKQQRIRREEENYSLL